MTRKQDVAIKTDENGLYDLSLDGPDFLGASGYGSIIPVQYFSDARAPESVVQGANNRRGWVADKELGGLLWILDQARMTQETINLAEVYARESLQMLIDTGLASSVECKVEESGRGIIIKTIIQTPDNITKRYMSMWRDTKLA